MNTYLFLILCGCVMTEKPTGQPLPGKPTNIQVLADSFNIGVQWNRPSETFGTIQNYVVTFAVLPNSTELSNVVDGQTTVALIPVGTHVGRLFRIRVRAKSDVGMGPYSEVRYIRTNCQRKIEIFPNTSVKIRSPGYLSGDPLEAGVMCSWRLETNTLYMIQIKFENLILITNRSSWNKSSCLNSSTYVEIGGIAKYCDLAGEAKTVITSFSNDMNLTLRTGMTAGGLGFALTAKSVMRLPGPPTHIHLSTTNQAIEVTWQPPVEKTLPLTSFIIRYRVLNGAQSFKVTVGPGMRRFYLNTEAFKGQLLSINMSAVISFQEGLQSIPVFIRAPCRGRYYIETGNSVNILSPNYPNTYPRNVLCTWEVITDPEVNLLITFIDFRLEDSPFCFRDYLLFSFNQTKQKECTGLRIPSTVSIESSALNLTFVSNARKQFQGFMLYVEAQGKTTIPSPISSTTNQQSRNLSSSQELHLIQFFTRNISNTTLKTTSESTTRGSMNGSQKYPPSTLLATFRPSQFILSNMEGRGTPISGNSNTLTTGIPRDQSNTYDTINTDHTKDLTVSVTDKGSVSEPTERADVHIYSFSNLYAKTKTDIPGITADLTQITDITKRRSMESFRTHYLKTTAVTLRQNMRTTQDIGHIPDTVSAFRQYTTKFENISESPAEINSGDKHLTTIDIVIWSISSIAFLLALLIGLFIYKRSRRNTKIHIDRSGSNRRGHIELHDIINLSRKPSNSYEVFEVNRTQQTTFTNSKINENVAKGVMQGDNIHSVQLNHVSNRKKGSLRLKRMQYSNPDKNKVNGYGQGDSIYHTAFDSILKRHHSFPALAKQRQIFREVKRTVAAFDFIEDKDKLATQITSKMQRKRMNSL